MAERLSVQGHEIGVISRASEDYISITDIAKYRNEQDPFAIINNWMRGRSTIEFLGLWEKLSNPDFKPLEFERFRSEAGSNYFVLSPKRMHSRAAAVMAPKGQTGVDSVGGARSHRCGNQRIPHGAACSACFLNKAKKL